LDFSFDNGGSNHRVRIENGSVDVDSSDEQDKDNDKPSAPKTTMTVSRQNPDRSALKKYA